jgi:single-strand DNA-binding protein
VATYLKITALGNMTRDPQLKFLPNGDPVVEFGIASNRKYRTKAGEDREEVAFLDCEAFGKTAELVNQYFTKGKPIHFEGRLKYEQWDDKNGGGKRSKLKAIVTELIFLPGGNRESDGGGESEAPRVTRPPSHRPPRPPAGGEPPFSGNQEFKEDDIPF